MEKGEDPYNILGVGYDATEAEIKKVYRRGALKHHPDKQTYEDREKAHDVFAKFAAAYAMLMDPVKRYDWKHANEEKLKRSGSFQTTEPGNTQSKRTSAPAMSSNSHPAAAAVGKKENPNAPNTTYSAGGIKEDLRPPRAANKKAKLTSRSGRMNRGSASPSSSSSSSASVSGTADTSHVYVLLLKEKKVYVGFSERPIGERFIEHFNYQGSKWTTVYRPVQVLHVQPGGKELENEMTLKMMEKYGWWNVRGGSWCQFDMLSCPPALLEWQRLNLPQPLQQNQPTYVSSNCNQNMNNGCTYVSSNCNRNMNYHGCSRCGRDSHSVSNCYARTNVNGRALGSYYSESDCSLSEYGACYRCGRSTHFARDCYARTHINGFYL